MALKSEAIRRAVHGDAKGVYFKGLKVGTEYVKSDSLLTTLLKALPEFSGADEKETTQNVFNGPVQINNMPRAENYEEWLKMKDLTLARRAEQEALPAPSDAAIAAFNIMAPSDAQIEDATFVEVTAPFAALAGVL